MFLFIRYIKPHFFKINVNISTEILQRISVEQKLSSLYNTPEAIINDILFQQTYNLSSSEFLSKTNTDISDSTVKNLRDNYTFIKRHFNVKWLTWIFIIRCISNPLKFIKELKSYLIALQKPKFTPKPYYLNLIKKKKRSLRSVVDITIPTYKRYSSLKKTLFELENYKELINQVIIADQNKIIDKTFYTQFKLPIKLIENTSLGQWSARNSCLKHTKAKYTCIVDDENEKKEGWLNHLIYFMEEHKIECCTGRSSDNAINELSIAYELDTSCTILKTLLIKKIQFDERFNLLRWGDHDFGYRLSKLGVTIINHPFANYKDPKCKTGGLQEFNKSIHAFQLYPLLNPFPNIGVTLFFRKHSSIKYLYIYLGGIILANINPITVQKLYYSLFLPLKIFYSLFSSRKVISTK